jgi:23S rRNA (guanine745-N1)-methyltransferase
MLGCPACGLALVREAGRYACERGHAYDVAREGYVNLLPPGRHAGGDTDEMLRARRRFLERGHYAPVADALAERAEGTILDAGCGEGWYLRRLGGERVGVDVARTAVRMAARRDPAAVYAVASVHRLPVLDGAVDTLLSVFSHRSFAEFARVLAPRGRVLHAEPGPDHLREVRALLSDDPRMRRETAARVARDGPLRVAAEDRVRGSLDLDAESLTDLLAMTPFALHAPRGRQADVRAREALTVTLDVVVKTLVRDP